MQVLKCIDAHLTGRAQRAAGRHADSPLRRGPSMLQPQHRPRQDWTRISVRLPVASQWHVSDERWRINKRQCSVSAAPGELPRRGERRGLTSGSGIIWLSSSNLCNIHQPCSGPLWEWCDCTADEICMPGWQLRSVPDDAAGRTVEQLSGCYSALQGNVQRCCMNRRGAAERNA